MLFHQPNHSTIGCHRSCPLTASSQDFPRLENTVLKTSETPCYRDPIPTDLMLHKPHRSARENKMTGKQLSKQRERQRRTAPLEATALNRPESMLGLVLEFLSWRVIPPFPQPPTPYQGKIKKNKKQQQPCCGERPIHWVQSWGYIMAWAQWQKWRSNSVRPVSVSVRLASLNEKEEGGGLPEPNSRYECGHLLCSWMGIIDFSLKFFWGNSFGTTSLSWTWPGLHGPRGVM